MAKKGQAQLQIEVTNDEEWEKLLQKEGLIGGYYILSVMSLPDLSRTEIPNIVIVVDIYSDWCGPCMAMLNNLRKLKLEVGGDNLHIAQAKCDGITDLARFRNKSEPTWMFISNGKMLCLMFGADSPKILQQIIDELNREAEVREGIRQRIGQPVTSLSPEEQAVADVVNAKENAARQLEEEKVRQAIYDRRMAVAQVVLQTVPRNGVILVFPQARDMVKPALADLWEQSGLAISVTERPHLTEATIEELLYFTEFRFSDADITELTGAPCIAYFLKTQDSEFDGNVDDLVKRLVYGEMMEPPGSPDTPAQLLKSYIVLSKPQKSVVEVPSAVVLQDSSTQQSTLELQSKLQLGSSTVLHSKEMLDATVQSFANVLEEETIEISGIWVPPNSLVRATAIKLLFPKIYEPIALPEPIPTPPHVAIAFDAIKRREIYDLMKTHENEIMHYGFFTSEKPDTAKLIAKTIQKYERSKERSPTIRMVIQLSRKKSEALCAFSQMNPTYISHNTVIGEEDCKVFFPEDYEETVAEEEIAVVETKKRKGKKVKKAKATSEEAVTDVVADEETELEVDFEEETETEIGEEEEADGDAEEGEEQETVDEEDKATSPMPE